MGIDASIYQNAGRVKSVAEYDAEALANQRNQLAAMGAQQEFDQRRQGVADANALREATRGFGADQTANYNALLRTGNMKAAQDYQKSNLDAQKTQGDIGKTAADTKHVTAQTDGLALDQQILRRQQHLSELANVVDVPGAQQWLSDAVKSGEVPFDRAAAVHAQLQQNPASLAQWKLQAQMGGMKLLDQLKLTVESADNKATNETSRANNADTNKTHIVTTGMTNDVTRRGQNMTDARAARTQSDLMMQPEYKQDADGNFIALPKKLPNGQPIVAMPVLDGAGKPVGAGGGGKMTEDQGKATGWLVQAETAYKNMQGAMKRDPDAKNPGLGDAIGRVPGLSAVGNSLTGANRQQFNQASSSFGEAVLRAATGAGVNKDEALQKSRELTPQFGDSEEVIAQKMAAFPVYIESLKVRAGPGAKKAASITAPAGGFSDAEKERRYQEWKAKQK